MAGGVETNIRPAESFPHAKLLIKDFDGTTAQTFEKSPDGIDILAAYNIAVENVFGQKAFALYIANGGLRNRAPIEVVQELNPDIDGDELVDKTNELVEEKLSVLLSQVGERLPDGNVWPRPMPGYLELQERIEQARTDGHVINDLILSSGHQVFIEKTYKTAWGISVPDYIVAEETVRDKAKDTPLNKFVKPSPALIDMSLGIWRESYGIVVPSRDERERVISVGDDVKKDGQMAQASGITFVHVADKYSSPEAWQTVAIRLGLGYAALPRVETYG